MKKRLKYVDIARAFAIILIVFGHTLQYSEDCKWLFKLIYSFHVALFFILSGYIFNVKGKSFKSFIKNKFFRILIPYFVWEFIFLIPYMILGRNVGDALQTNSSFQLGNQLINIVIGNGVNSALKQNSALWFLPALFSMEIIYYWIINYANQKSKKYKLILLVPILIIAYISKSFPNVIIPFGINTVLQTGILFYIGYLLKELNLIDKSSKLFNRYIIAFFGIIGIISAFANPINVSFIDYQYGKYITLAFLSGISLSIVVIYFSYIINSNRVLEYIGKNTMSILIFHKLIILIFQTKLGKIPNMLKNSNFIIEFSMSILICILSIIVSIVIGNIIRRICPILIGEKKK